MKVISAVSAVLLAGMLFSAEFMLEDFKNFKAKDWSSFRKITVEKSAAGAKVYANGGWSTKIYPGNWKTRRDWNKKYNGIAFKIKGSGADDYAAINLMLDWSISFRWYFPLKNTQWQEFRVHFDDFTPVGNHALEISSAPGNIPIDSFRGIRQGDRWTIGHNNAKRKPVSYEIADIRLISDARPFFEIGKYPVASFSDVKKKMKSGKKVRITCLGDSITAGTGLPRPDGTRYADVTGELLRTKYNCNAVEMKSLAVGGACISDIVAWLERDFAEIPDLVTFMCGYNDFSNAVAPEVYRNFLELLIKRVTALSKGKTAIVLFTTIPGCGPRFNAHDKFAQVVRETAAKYKVGCFDLNAIFKKKFSVQNVEKVFRDAAHPNVQGHRLIAEQLAEFLGK